MNLEFSSDQQLIREQARNFLSRECPPERVRSAMDASAPFDQPLWQQIAELGWTAMTIPEAHGGLGLGCLELCVIAEEVGRAVAPIPFSSSAYLATEALVRWGDAALQAQYLPQLASGACIGTFADSEGLGASAPATTYRDGVVSGTKLPVTDGDIAQIAIVTALDSDGQQGLCLVALDNDQVRADTLNSMDPSRSQARLVFDNAPAHWLAGPEALPALLDHAAVLLAFEQIGGAQAAMDMGMTYTKERYAFGRAVASFQAIKHKFADMYVAIELARSNAYYAASALSQATDDLPLAAATARVSATDAYYLASKENIQAHGGMGFTWEFDCHLFYRRAQLLSGVIGTQPQWKERVATRLLQVA